MDLGKVFGCLPLATAKHIFTTVKTSEVPFQLTVPPTAGEGVSFPIDTGDIVSERGVMAEGGLSNRISPSVPINAIGPAQSATHHFIPE